MLPMQSLILVASFMRVASLEPMDAARYAAGLEVKHPAKLTARLRSIAHRESRGKRIGKHKRDEGWAERMYRKALRRGILPECHRGKDPARYGVRGAWGLSAAYNLRYLPDPCAEPELLNIPAASARIAAIKMLKADRMGIEARVLWAGAKKCAERNKRTGRTDCVKPRVRKSPTQAEV